MNEIKIIIKKEPIIKATFDRVITINTGGGSDTYKVKTDINDTQPAFLDQKVDGTTLEVDSVNHKLRVKGGVFASVTHTHDDRYYTEAEVDNLLANKADVSHTHDDRYYTETEVDNLLAGKSDVGHTHDDRYYTETEVNNLLNTKEDLSNKVTSWSVTPSNTRYPSEKLVKDSLDLKANISHTHTASDITDFDTEVSNNPDVSANTSARHTHSNKVLLDNLIDTGAGNKFLADDGTYKLVSTADEKVKADASDTTAGYLSDKVDNSTVEVDTVNHKLKVKDGVFASISHTHVASDITDFDAAVSNNSDVSANTNARHTHANKAVLDATEESFTTSLKSNYDAAYNHSQITSGNPHNVTAVEVGAIPASEKGQPDGVATLDATGVVPTTQLPEPRFYWADESTSLNRLFTGRNFDETFDTNTLSSDWQWASDASFIVPTEDTYSDGSVADTYSMYKPSSLWFDLRSGDAFVYKTGAPFPAGTNSGTIALTGFASVGNNGFVGVRWDDGTSNNYVEFGIIYDASSGQWKWRIVEKKGASTNTATSADGVNIPLPMNLLLWAAGTTWSGWIARGYISLPLASPVPLQMLKGIGTITHNWTPQRVGIVIRRGDSHCIGLVDHFGTSAV